MMNYFRPVQIESILTVRLKRAEGQKLLAQGVWGLHAKLGLLIRVSSSMFSFLIMF